MIPCRRDEPRRGHGRGGHSRERWDRGMPEDLKKITDQSIHTPNSLTAASSAQMINFGIYFVHYHLEGYAIGDVHRRPGLSGLS